MKKDRKKRFKLVCLLTAAMNDKFTGKGGKSRLAKELGITRQAITTWANSYLIPEKHHTKLMQLFMEYNVKHPKSGQPITREDLI